MVEAIVSMVMGRLCDAVVQEVLLLHGVDDQVDMMKRELARIRFFLRDADNKRRRNPQVNHWIGQVRGVAHRIEDVIDTFLVEVDGIEVDRGRPKKLGCCTSLIACGKKPMELPVRHRLGKEIENIKKLILEIAESTNRYGIKELEDCVEEDVRRPVRSLVIPEIDDNEVVGFEADIKNIIELLVDQNTNRRTIISIVGTGGLEKTTLAHKAYTRTMKNHDFECHIWLSVSQEFKLIEFLRKMLKKLHPNESNESLDTLDEEAIMLKIYQTLETKKYLLVLDDVWTEDVWRQLEKTLLNANNGSRVLMTTRNKDVAMATSSSKLYESSFLSKEISEKLLLKKALGPNAACPNDLLGLAEKFANKCGGLPLALVVVGGLLSKKEANYTEWNKVLNNINWKEFTDILASSYDDLPAYLKPCFMYFACFQEDFKIPEDAIVKMWVSEGFIAQEIEGIMEDTANYLEELI